jgi:23S rRNA (pseudouridine1915-N3)-methyltransferase
VPAVDFMKWVVLAVGKLREAWVAEGCAEYAKRFRGKMALELVEVKDDAELGRRLAALRAGGRVRVWALDERGEQLTSDELARRLGETADAGEATAMVFVIGGADGLPAEVVRGADRRWSLGKLTLPHRIARLVVVEQLYRALTILRREPYHRP